MEDSFASYIHLSPGRTDLEAEAQKQSALIRAYGEAHGLRFDPFHVYVDFAQKPNMDSRFARSSLVEVSALTPRPFRFVIVCDYGRLSGHLSTVRQIARILIGNGVDLHSVDHRLHYAPDEFKERVKQFYERYLVEPILMRSTRDGAQ